MFSGFKSKFFSLAVLAQVATVAVRADQIIYSDDALSNGWQDWSWGSTIDYEATNIAEGTSSISVDSTAWAALSLKSPSTIEGFAGLRFDISVCTLFIMGSRRISGGKGSLTYILVIIGRPTRTSVLYPEHDG